MSKIDELIKELCPDGVEIKELNDVIISLNTGLNPRQFFKLNTEDAENYYVTIREMHGGKVVFSDKTDRMNDEAMRLCNNRSNLEKGDVLFSGTGTIGETVVLDETPQNWNIKEGVYTIKPNPLLIDSRYLSHLLGSSEIRNRYMKKVAGGTVKSIPMAELKKLKLPVPPLEVQREIVRVLDSFTLLTAELTAELTARKKQYEYYRDLLIERKSSDTIEVMLDEIAEYSKERIKASDIDELTYVGVDNLLQNKQGKTISNYVPTEGNLTKYYPNDILLGNIRPYLRKIWFADSVGGTNGDVLVIHVTSDRVLPKYLYCNISSERFFEYDNGKAKGAKMPRGDKEAIMKYKLVLPPLDVQQKIVDTLDNFEQICNDLNIGLPAEIEARQK